MTKFVRKGKSKYFWVPAVAGYNPLGTGSATLAEVAAGTDLSVGLNEISGLSFKSSLVPAPVMATRLTAKISGEDELQDPVLTFLDDDVVTAIRTALVRDALGFIVVAPYGAIATKRNEVWPAQSLGPNDQHTVANEPAKFEVSFAITGIPSLNGSF